MDCPYCGAKNRDRAKFCRSCAKRLDGKESAPSEENDESESLYSDSDQGDELVKPASGQKKKDCFRYCGASRFKCQRLDFARPLSAQQYTTTES